MEAEGEGDVREKEEKATEKVKASFREREEDRVAIFGLADTSEVDNCYLFPENNLFSDQMGQ